MNTFHICLAYYILAVNAVAFIVYDIAKYLVAEKHLAEDGSPGL